MSDVCNIVALPGSQKYYCKYLSTECEFIIFPASKAMDPFRACLSRFYDRRPRSPKIKENRAGDFFCSANPDIPADHTCQRTQVDDSFPLFLLRDFLLTYQVLLLLVQPLRDFRREKSPKIRYITIIYQWCTHLASSANPFWVSQSVSRSVSHSVSEEIRSLLSKLRYCNVLMLPMF